jgi:DNA/RNA-binding domain of Phe-tRNA-synthetase-like protein
VFGYHQEIEARFPAARAAVVVARNVVNDVAAEALGRDYRAAQAEAVGVLGEGGPADHPSIKAWRSVFTAFGVKPTQHRNAAEALLRRLARHGDIPSINPAVDLGNLVSIRHALPVAVFDLATLVHPVTVTVASGEETFTGIGSSQPEHPAPGEVIFVDGRGDVVARRWCWKQSAGGATGPDTTDVMYVIEAVHNDAVDAVSEAADQLVDLLARYQPAARIDRFTAPD